MTTIRIALACILAGFQLLQAASAALDDADRRHQVDAVFAEYNQTHGPGMAVGVYQHGRPLYLQGYGMADLQNPTVIDPNTVFHVASMSKHFTAFAVLLLADEGKLDLDADIRRYLPGLPDFGKPITARHLIHHTSGLRDQESLYRLGGLDRDGVQRTAQILRLLSRQRSLNFSPGSEYAYSNTGYTLLGELVLATTGESLRAFTTRRIFEPLGMHDTFFLDDLREVVPHRAHAYARDRDRDGRWRASALNQESAGATNLQTTVADLARWAGNFSDPRVGDAALMARFTAAGQLDDGTPMDYGFGLSRGLTLGRDSVGHEGSEGDFNAMFLHFLDSGLSVAVLANRPADVVSLARRVAAIHLGDRTPPPPDPPARKRISPVLARALAGQYAAGRRVLQMSQQQGRLMWTHDGTPRPVVLRRDGCLDEGDQARAEGRYLCLDRDAQGRVLALEDGQPGGSRVRMVRYRRVAPADTDFDALVGRYRSEELDITYDATVVDGQLHLGASWRIAPVPLQPWYRDAFQGSWPFSHVAFERDDAGQPHTLVVGSGSRDLDVRFERMP